MLQTYGRVLSVRLKENKDSSILFCEHETKFAARRG